MSAPIEGTLTCEFCTRQFSRREHLTRHLSSHVNQRRHQCSSCGKAFNRCDLLTRHRRISCSTVTKGKPKQSQTRIRGACDRCATAKVRCSPSLPCTRCVNKGIPCTKRAGQRSTALTECDDAFLVSQPLLDQSPPVHGQLEASHHIEDTGVRQCLSGLSTPLLSVDSGHSQTEPSPMDIPAASATEAPMFDWSFQHCMPPQGLSMDFLDLLAFPGTGYQLDLDHMSEPHGATTGRVDARTFAAESAEREQSTSKQLPDLSDSWHTYGGSGMVQPNLWEKSRPKGSIDPHDANKAVLGRDEPDGAQKSLTSFLSLVDILAMEDHNHVAQVHQGQVMEVSALIAKTRCLEALTCNPGVKDLLNNPKVMNAFVQLYFEHYHLTLPFLHKATFNVSNTPPLLLLAVAAIGSRFSKVPQAHTLSYILRGTLRKALDTMVDENIHQTIEIPFAQAALLNQIQMAFDGVRHIALKAQFQRAMLVTVCRGLNSRMRREDLLQRQDNGPDASYGDEAVSKWLGRELCRRLTYAIWLIDCQFSLHASVPPMMSLDDLDPSLPCPETLWDMNGAALSRELNSSQMSLKDAIDALKLGQLVQSKNLGLFSRLITMTAVFYQWYTATSVNRYILDGDVDQSAQRLPMDQPFGEIHGVVATGNGPTPSRPLVPAVHRAHWRSTTTETISLVCTNVTAYRESDASQLIKLHHHISILLIVPLQPMCEYIGWMATKQCTTAARNSLCTWLRADIQNARRAVMHAMTLFCFIRRRKTAAHSENHHLFVAVLTIWTFFSLDPVARATDGDSESSATNDEVPSSWSCCCIDWDGGVDAGEKERWIQAPGHPRVRIAGVGNLEEPSGLHRILVEAHRILLSDQVWGISRLFAGVLEGLVRRGSACV
ncbi:fungal-specific transcription factor domain-containing protein [Aspergillus pseudodeflectus]|uniref:Fungal-specific transcription factor domain-containing protein n=1 Tax=Aspergillus pseudodeflectus TaxID=176178 RepID=A0ABR4K5N6_9EURO